METIKINNKEVLVIAHRGLSGFETENTCAAFIAAGVKTYYGIETDVHVTKDGKYLICHDDNIERVTGVDMVIETSNYADLKQNKVFDKDGSYRSDLVLPDLIDYLNICKRYNKEAILELKNEMKVSDIDGIVEMVKASGWYNHTTFISFYPQNVIYLREKDQKASIQFLTDRFNADILHILDKYRLDLDIYYVNLTQDAVDIMHSLGLKVNVWTVDDLEEAKKLIAMGVDMITSNILE